MSGFGLEIDLIHQVVLHSCSEEGTRVQTSSAPRSINYWKTECLKKEKDNLTFWHIYAMIKM